MACLSHAGHSEELPVRGCPGCPVSLSLLPNPPSPSKLSLSLTGGPKSPVALDLLRRSDLYWFIAKIFPAFL